MDMYKIHTIYKATCNITGLSYIGRTSRKLSDRIFDHAYVRKNREKSLFGQMIQLYGLNNFSWEEMYLTWDDTEAKLVECMFIKQYDTFRNGYNSNNGLSDKLLEYYRKVNTN